ncbi:tetratricopeptide repeat protein [Streptococcus iniae]|nr:tetratricopeptide repeat protein [Streptococcus iniae]
MTDKIDLAWNLFFQGKNDEAEALIADSFQFEKCQDFSFLNLMTYLYLGREDFDSALQVMKRYLELAAQQSDLEQQHIGLHQTAMVYRDMGEFAKALGFIQKEKEIIESYFSDDALKKSVNNYEQGYLRLKLGDSESAFPFMVQSLEQALKTEDLIAQACSYRGLGELYLAQKNKGQAKNHFLKALSLFEASGDSLGENDIHGFLKQC